MCAYVHEHVLRAIHDRLQEITLVEAIFNPKTKGRNIYGWDFILFQEYFFK